MEFVHLHVASGFSMQYGASTPAALVERAAHWGQPALALTDRDGLYGAVRFVQACSQAGIDPILGVDLALRPEPVDPGRPLPTSRTPVRGGALVDPKLPRITVLARGRGSGLAAGLGWSRLCRLVTGAHVSGTRGEPMVTPHLVADLVTGAVAHARSGGIDSARSDGGPGATTDGGPSPLVVLLGPDSDVGRAVLARRRDVARARLARWQALLPPDALAVETVCHGGPEGTPMSLHHAARLLSLGREADVPVVLTAAVRHAEPREAATVDVLDAARRLVPLDVRHLDRVTTAGHLASGAAMRAVARQIVEAAGAGIGGGASAARQAADGLLTETVALARDCVQDARADLGIGSVHLPEPAVLGLDPRDDPDQVLAERCRAAVPHRYSGATGRQLRRAEERLDDELGVIAALGYPTYFLTVGAVVDLIRDLGVRVAARGSGAGSIVTYLLGISGVEPLRYGLLMERFCSPLRAELPDIDIDVESARRTEIYEKVLARFGGERVTCVSMMDTYRVRHAIRDVGAALGLPPTEIDAMAKAFPHIGARHARAAIAELPELRATGLGSPRYDVLFDLVERLDGLPRHVALHPCGVVLSDSGLLDRTPVEASWMGFPMSQFDKDDVETLGLLKLDILGIRMQSAMAHAVDEVARVDGLRIDLDDEQQVPHDDEATFRLIRTSHTLGCFQIESPGQRELLGKFGPQRFEDLIVDISLFRPGPVKSDMIVPFLNVRHGWSPAEYLHDTLIPALQETEGVVVFHEQVLLIVAETAGVSLAEADEVRRALGSRQGQADVEAWWRPAALARGYRPQDVDRIWEVLKAFASFGFCKAHAAAFALPTYQSAWLKTHHPAAFLSGVLTHDPGMYPKRLILDDARSLGIDVLGLDVNVSTDRYVVERVPVMDSGIGRPPVHPDLPDARGYGIRLSLADVKGISGAEVAQIVAGQPYVTLADFWNRAHVSRPVVERLVLAGGFDALYGIAALRPDGAPGGGSGSGLGRRGRITRRDLLLHVAELDRWSRSFGPPGGRSRSGSKRWSRRPASLTPGRYAARPDSAGPQDASAAAVTGPAALPGVAALTAAQSQAAAPVAPSGARSTQLVLDLGDAPQVERGTGLPELTGPERVRAELDILGLDASAHIIDFYAPMLRALRVTRAADLLAVRNRSEVWVAGVKVATQTPPIRSGRRVVFLTVDDGTGPADATFFEDAQGPYATTVFHSWMLLVRGVTRRTGPRGISLRATGAWELSGLWAAWSAAGLPGVLDALAAAEQDARERSAAAGEAETSSAVQAAAGAAGGRRPGEHGSRAGGMGGSPRVRRVLVHASGFRQSPYADVKPPGDDARDGRRVAAEAMPPRKLWHSSPGSSGH